jgi:hypothetical protein
MKRKRDFFRLNRQDQRNLLTLFCAIEDEGLDNSTSVFCLFEIQAFWDLVDKFQDRLDEEIYYNGR